MANVSELERAAFDARVMHCLKNKCSEILRNIERFNRDVTRAT